jgi:pyridinium-3,5-bisthiocarboxylic acid mononucleotide nickel chelatase
MQILYLDCFSGISGDMTVGALADLGVNPSTFEWELSKIDLGNCHLHFDRQTRGGIAGVKFDVHAGTVHLPGQGSSSDHRVSHDHSEREEEEGHSHDGEHLVPHPAHEHIENFEQSGRDPQENRSGERQIEGLRGFAEIRRLIQESELSGFVKEHATSIFRRIGEAEAQVHAASIENVQFHEVGALDSIVDVVLTCVGIEALKVERIYFSSLVEGQGTFRFSHGTYPLPGPATLEILKEIPIRQIAVPFELITPTGAAIVAEFNHSIGPLPELRPTKIGYGLGTREIPDRPNALRAILGSLEQVHPSERIIEVQTNIDDLSPEILGAVQERLFGAGALDAFFTPIQMKKGRPATLFTVLCETSLLERVAEILFTDTSTFGVRYRELNRKVLERESVTVETAVGQIQVKVGSLRGRILQAAPEFESCRAAAERTDTPLKRVYELAVEAYWQSALPHQKNSSAGDEKVVELPH